VSAALLLFEDSGWPRLRPLTDLLPVPALAFGGSTLASRWVRAAGVPLAGIEARPETLAAWAGAPVFHPAAASDRDEVLIANAAALPGPWLERAQAGRAPSLFVSGERIAAARVPFASVRSALGSTGGLERALRSLEAPRVEVEARFVTYPWNLIEWNAAALAEDLARDEAGIRGDVHPQAVVLERSRVAVQAGARVDALAVLDARGGPIRIEARAVILPHTVVIGPCVVGEGTQLLGGFVSRSTLGPECRIAGEVEECVWQGFSNKRHHGFVGHSAIGEWVNLGALTTTSDLKNNYGTVRVWVEGERIDSGTGKVGSIIGAHVKTGIGTLLPTGASIGTGSNLFGGGRFAPALVPPFSWWDGATRVEHRLEPFLETARTAMGRRGRVMDAALSAALAALHARTAAERAAPAAGAARG
jgi:UDP-N-acetylglucosamine diphosphorylase/glucosamine-1-phosphate N-acetyltransferase